MLLMQKHREEVCSLRNIAEKMKDIEKTNLSDEQYRIINGEKVIVSRRKRRRNMSLYYFIVVVFVIMALIFLSLTVFFNIKKTDISGTDLYTDEQIIQIAGISNKDNLFRIDTDQMKSDILSSFPYLEDITIKRKLPSTLQFTAVQAVPMANIQNKDGTFCVISTTGRIVETGVLEKKQGLVTVTGMDLKVKDLGKTYEDKDGMKSTILNQMLSEINTLGMTKLNTINLKDRTNIKMKYDNRLDIEIGSSVDLGFKIRYVEAVIDKLSETYQGTLIYHNATSGLSAIPKTAEATS